MFPFNLLTLRKNRAREKTAMALFLFKLNVKEGPSTSILLYILLFELGDVAASSSRL